MDMKWKVLLHMEWNIMLGGSRYILLETNAFEFHSNDPLPFW